MDAWCWIDGAIEMKKTLNVVKTASGTELRVDGKVVVKLGHVSFEDARLAAYNYAWVRGDNMWDIIGMVEEADDS